jgi:C-terminal processing protease CtpA/Prc
MRKLFLATIIFTLFFSSCKKDPDPVETGLTDAMARDSLYYLMRQWYYWYDRMPVVKKEDYSGPYELMEAMVYPEYDKWSFVADYNEFIAEMSGEFVGHGIRIGVDDGQKARIAMIYKRSPLYQSGVRRGWIVKSVNGYDVAGIITRGDAAAYNNVMGAVTAGVTNKFIFTKPDGTDVEITSAKSSFAVNSVLFFDTLHLSSGITGQLVFEAFIIPSPAELDTAFRFFEKCGIKDLILDMRYNSGGYLHVAQGLASEIAGQAVYNSGSAFATLQFNDKNMDENYTYKFSDPDYSLSFSRLVVISTRMTASASEAVMNGLKPFMDVITIGDTTNGKPVGMNGWSVGEKYWYWPITFKIINKDNEGDYFDGFTPDKSVPDDITHDFDDRNELCLKEAINYLESGTFSAKRSERFYRYPQYSEKPAWRSRGILLK